MLPCAKKTLLLFAIYAYQVSAEPFFPPVPNCQQRQQFANDLLRSPATKRAQEIRHIPEYCQADAVAQAVYNLRQQQRNDEGIALANDFLTTKPCDPSPYYEAAVSYEAVGKNEIAACYYGKAEALTRSNARNTIRADYARVSATLPAVPKNELACSRLFANRIKACPRSRDMQVVTDAVPPTMASASIRIHFDYNSAELSRQAYTQIQQLATQIQQGISVRTLGIKLNSQEESGPGNGRVSSIRLIGHTDTQGSDTYNLMLSQKRAESVQRTLSDLLPGTSIQASGQGKRRPLIRNAVTEADHAINRRVEIVMD
jgi:outer membrane protein OmpA-like peptidoglycan-associated protein